MNLKKCILTRNDCYKKGTKMTGGKPTGIVVHSTGANNKTLKRYVQPLTTDADYATIVADIGKNVYGNDWNHTAAEMGRSVCVHAFIGINAAGAVETYQTLPFDICCWGVGSGSKGSYNYNPTARVQFEICEDDLTDESYFNAAFKEAIEFCAYLCKTYGFGVDKISSHHESYMQGYGGNHADCDHWLKKFGKTMDWFRAQVESLLKTPVPAQPTTPASSSLKVGDIVDFKGTVHYTSANAKSGVACKPGKAKITAAYPSGAHPYHLVRINGGGSTVYGWVNTSDFSGASDVKESTPVVTTPSAPAATIKVGSRVKVKSGAKTYTGGGLAAFVYKTVYDVQQIKGDRVVIGLKGQVTAAVKLSDLILQ